MPPLPVITSPHVRCPSRDWGGEGHGPRQRDRGRFRISWWIGRYRRGQLTSLQFRIGSAESCLPASSRSSFRRVAGSSPRLPCARSGRPLLRHRGHRRGARRCVRRRQRGGHGREPPTCDWALGARICGATAVVLAGREIIVAQAAPSQAILVQDGQVYAVPDVASWRGDYAPDTPAGESHPLGFSDEQTPRLYHSGRRPATSSCSAQRVWGGR